MKGISVLKYSLKQAFKSLRKNRMFTVASIGTIAACLFLFGLFYFAVGNFQNMIKEVENSVGVTVFFDEGVAEPEIQSIGEAIKTRPEVSQIVYVSPEEAWEKFKQDMFQGDGKELADTFGQDNPLAGSASYEVYLNDITKQDSLVKYLETVPGIRQVNRSDQTARSLGNINTLVGYVSGAIILILLIVSIFLIKTTISTGITVRRTEIEIMRLMGASDYFIRAPFVVEGVIIGILGAIVPLAILFLIYGRVIAFVTTKFTSLSGILSFLSTAEVFQILIPVSLLLGIGIGFLGSYFTVRKHLHV